MNLQILERASVLFPVLLAFGLLTACGGDQSTAGQYMDGATSSTYKGTAMDVPEMEASEAFRGSLGRMYDSYESLKNTLVATDGEQARLGAENMLQMLGAIDASGLSADSRSYWDERAASMNRALETMGEADGIQGMRLAFSELTQPLAEAMAAFQANEQTLYVQHCPMAFDNAGADWISKEEQISNPYFGDEMMRCGSVQARIEHP